MRALIITLAHYHIITLIWKFKKITIFVVVF